MNIKISRSGREIGEFDLVQMKSLFEVGGILPSDEVFLPKDKKWMPIENIPSLMAELSPPSPMVPIVVTTEAPQWDLTYSVPHSTISNNSGEPVKNLKGCLTGAAVLIVLTIGILWVIGGILQIYDSSSANDRRLCNDKCRDLATLDGKEDYDKSCVDNCVKGRREADKIMKRLMDSYEK